MITVLFTVNIDLKPARIFFPRIASRWISNNIAFILSFFRNVVSESNQINSLKNAQDDPFFRHIFRIIAILNNCLRGKEKGKGNTITVAT